MEVKIKKNKDKVINRFKKFSNELLKLCDRYGLEIQMATDNETNDNFIVINVADFIKEEDFKIKVRK